MGWLTGPALGAAAQAGSMRATPGRQACRTRTWQGTTCTLTSWQRGMLLLGRRLTSIDIASRTRLVSSTKWDSAGWSLVVCVVLEATFLL